MDKFYITTTLPYVNSDPHIGFAMEIVRADVLARMNRLLGKEVWFNTGTDEHGQKIYQKATEKGISPKEYCDNLAERFKQLKTDLDLSWDSFIRTTDERHKNAAQDFWQKCFESGDIYKKNYSVKYCVGCELEKTDSDLVEGKCPDHPNVELETREEENYFFKFSNYQEKLLDLYRNNPNLVSPDFRMKEITNFVEGGLNDFSISRLKSKMPWGVEVPNDPEHVMYVWFDALVNYISVLGWPDSSNVKEWWPGVQVCGKDNLRQQTAMWQAMLMSAGVENSKKIFVNGFILSGGQKMSKSLGNVIDPLEWVKKYGTEPVRYFLLSSLSSFEDSDVTEEKFKEVYTSDLVNGLGNLAARVATLCEKHPEFRYDTEQDTSRLKDQVFFELGNYRFDTATQLIMGTVRGTDNYLSSERPWLKDLNEESQRLSNHVILDTCVNNLIQIGKSLEPILPETSKKILDQFTSERILKSDHLFSRIK